jgi:hypothetical protein
MDDLEQLIILPGNLPFLLDLLGIVSLLHSYHLHLKF